MKKVLLLLALLIASSNMYCQSVLGIPFGSSYDAVVVSLKERFGTKDVYDTGGDVEVYNISLGGFRFNFGEFSFQRSEVVSYFNHAFFQRNYKTDEVEDAKADRDYLYSLLKGKYANDFLKEYKNEQGFKCYMFGTNPKDESMPLGYIILKRAKSKGGDTFIYLILEYGPIFYIDMSSDF